MFQKTTLLLSLCFIQQLFTMDNPDYPHFFELCKNNQRNRIGLFIEKHKDNARFDINCQNEHGETALLHTASWDAWSSVDVLLQYGADKNIKDSYGQSLFSKAVYTDSQNIFKDLIAHYSPEEINAECKSIPLSRNTQYEVTPAVNLLVTDVLAGKSCGALNATDTAFLLSLCHNYIPFATQFLHKRKVYASHMYLMEYGKIIPLQAKRPIMFFAIREIFNTEYDFPSNLKLALISKFFKIKKFLLPEIADIIKQTYLRLIVPKDILSTVEALFYRQESEVGNLFLPTLLRKLLLSKKEKTELNLKACLTALAQEIDPMIGT